MKLIQEIFDFLSTIVLKELHAEKPRPAALKVEALQDIHVMAFAVDIEIENFFKRKR